jgi:hypothetical protein
MRSRHYAVLLVALLSFTASASAENTTVSPQGQSAPVNTGGPTISGVPVVGNTLQADTGKWSGPAAKYNYQWARCMSNGASCSPIASASAQTYRAANTDVGSTLRVVVTADNKNGTAVATSDPTSAITTPTPSTTPSTTTTTPSTTSTWATTTTTTPSTTSTATTTTTPTATTTTTTTSTPSLFSGNWDTGSTSQWSNGTQCAGDNINNGIARGTYSIVASPVAQGTFSANFALPAATVANACEAVQVRTLSTGTDDYYALDLMFPTNWQEPSPAGWGMAVAQFNYENIGIGPPVGLLAYSGKLAIVVLSGHVTNNIPAYSSGPDSNGNVHCATATCQVIPQGQMTLGVWHQVIVHIHWAADSSGSVETWWKRKGETSWNQQARLSGYPTVQWTSASPFAASYATTDKIGAYRGAASFPLSIRNDGFCRATTFAAAAACS